MYFHRKYFNKSFETFSFGLVCFYNKPNVKQLSTGDKVRPTDMFSHHHDEEIFHNFVLSPVLFQPHVQQAVDGNRARVCRFVATHL